jgi:glycosyltransferase involved in cell wall biosynthesis
MKICMVSPFGFQAATTRVRAYNLAKHLAGGGDEVILLISGKMEREEDNFRIIGVGREERSRMDFPISTISKYSALKKLRGVDVYHCLKALPWASLPTLMAKSGSKAVIDLDDWETGVTLDRGDPISPRAPPLWLISQATFVKFFEYRLPKLFDGVVVVSEFLKKECTRMRISTSRILKLPYGCDIDMFKPMPRDEELAKKIGIGEKRVVFTGSIGKLNLQVLIEAMKITIREVKDVVLLAVSPNRDLEEFKKYVSELGFPSEKLIVLGRQAHEMMSRILSLVDVAYVPNRFIEADEARSPSRMGEYMAAGKPIVANAVGVVREQLSDGAGSLVYSYDPKELASKIIEILEDERLARKMGKEAREKAEKVYSWSILTQELREFYHKIIEIYN